MSDRPLLSPNVLVGGDDPEMRARDYLRRIEGSEDWVDEAIVVAVNAATGKLERHANRRFRVRTYRTPVAISSTSTVDTKALTGAGFLALKAEDDAVGANLETGSRIASITSDGALVLTRKARATGAASVSFGSAPLYVDGVKGNEIQIPEFPVVEVYGASVLNDDGTSTALDITGARLTKETGRLILPNDGVADGRQNVAIECKAGYQPPSATVLGDHEDWNFLEQLCLRLTQVMFQDWAKQVGRVGDTNIVTFTQHIQDFKLPEDIAEGLHHYGRLWG